MFSSSALKTEEHIKNWTKGTHEEKKSGRCKEALKVKVFNLVKRKQKEFFQAYFKVKIQLKI